MFGGRFDPPHLGHREAVRGLFSNPGVKEVLVIPAATPPHKAAFSSAKHRAAMAHLGFSSTFADPFPSEVRVSEIELERSQQNPTKPSYSFDTLNELKKSYSQLAFVIGTDQLAQLHTWHRFPDLLGLCHWIVLIRQDAKTPDLNEKARETLQAWQGSGLIQGAGDSNWKISKYSTHLTLVPTLAPPVSSTQIREVISRSGQPPEDTLLPSVQAYLKENKIYGIQ